MKRKLILAVLLTALALLFFGAPWIERASLTGEAVRALSALRQLQLAIQTFHIEALKLTDMDVFPTEYPETLEELVSAGVYPADALEKQREQFNIIYTNPTHLRGGEAIILEIYTSEYHITMSRGGEGKLVKIQS